MSGWRAWGRGALVVLALLLVLVTFLPAWQTDRWWVREWDYPRLQVAALLLIVGALLLWVRLERSAGFALLCAAIVAALAWQISCFLPYFPPYPVQVEATGNCPADRQLTLLNANVLQTNERYDAVLSVVAERKPDVLLLLETGPNWARALASLDRDYPWRLAEPVPSTYGMMLFSRLPMTGEVRHLLQPAVPSMKTMVRLRGGQWVRFDGLHPEPPWPGDNSGERDAELITVGREIRNEGRAAIAMGDLNDVAWSRTSRLFKRVGGMGDPRVGRGLYPTFNANWPLLRWPLDQLFVSPHFEIMQIDRLAEIGSDHFPIFFRLCLKAPAAVRKVAPNAAPGTEAEATEELHEGRAEHREEAHEQ